MPGNIQAGRLLFVVQDRKQILLGHFGNLNRHIRRMILKAVKEADLTAQVFLLLRCDPANDRLVNRQKLAAIIAEAVHCAALNQILHGALVQFRLLQPLAEIGESGKRPVLLAFGDHLANQAAPDVLHCAESEANCIALHGEHVLGAVHVGRKNTDAQLLTLRNIPGDLLCIGQHGGHQRRHILPGIVALEPGRIVADLCIADGVRLIEGIVGKIKYLSVDFLRSLFGYAVGNRAWDSPRAVAVDKGLLLLDDDVLLLLGDGAAHIVGLSQRISAQLAENLDHLLLIDDAAVGHVQNWLELGCEIGNRLRMVLGLNEFGNGFHGAGPVERDNGGHIFNRLRLHLDTDAGDPAGLELEDARGLAFAQHSEGFRIVVGNLLHGESRHKALNLPLCVVDDRQVSKSEEVHLEQAQLLDRGHGKLGDDGILVASQRHIIRNRKPGNHDAGRMGRGVARHSLNVARRINQTLHLGIGVIHLLQLRILGQRRRQRDVKLIRNRLCHHVRLGVGHVERAAHVADCAARRHRAEGDNLRHTVLAVFARHVINDLAPSLLTEIRIKVRH